VGLKTLLINRDPAFVTNGAGQIEREAEGIVKREGDRACKGLPLEFFQLLVEKPKSAVERLEELFFLFLLNYTTLTIFIAIKRMLAKR
jgi:hypothetical protein